MAQNNDILMVAVGLGLAAVGYYVITTKGLLQRFQAAPPPDLPAPSVPQPQEMTQDQAKPVATGPSIEPPPNILELPSVSRVIELVNEHADKAGLTRPQIDDLLDQLDDYQDDLKRMRKMIPSEKDRFANSIAMAIVNGLQDPLLVKIKRDKRRKKIQYTVSAPKGWDIDVDRVHTNAGYDDDYSYYY